MDYRIPARGRSGFTLIELLVVIAIIAILAAVLFPTFLGVKDRAKLSKCMVHLRECGVACLMYCDDNEGHFPIPRIRNLDGSIMKPWAEGQCVGGQMGYQPDGTPYSPPHTRPLNRYIRSLELFHCPSEKRQECAGVPNEFPWKRFGNSYNFNVAFHYPTENDLFYTLLVLKTNPRDLEDLFTSRMLSDLRRPKRMILMGERAIHYWYGVSRDQKPPVPLNPEGAFSGHDSERPMTPIVFADGHVDFVLMTPGLCGDKWALAQKGWCPSAPGDGD